MDTPKYKSHPLNITEARSASEERQKSVRVVDYRLLGGVAHVRDVHAQDIHRCMATF